MWEQAAQGFLELCADVAHICPWRLVGGQGHAVPLCGGNFEEGGKVLISGSVLPRVPKEIKGQSSQDWASFQPVRPGSLPILQYLLRPGCMGGNWGTE